MPELGSQLATASAKPVRLDSERFAARFIVRAPLLSHMTTGFQVLSVTLAFILGVSVGWGLLPKLWTTTNTNTYREVMFSQSGACGNQYFLAPWSVTLSGMGIVETVVEPSNASLPISETHYTSSIEFKAFSNIVFSVTNGIYGYVVKPGYLAQSGSVTVQGSDVTVQVHEPPVTCQTQTTTG